MHDRCLTYIRPLRLSHRRDLPRPEPTSHAKDIFFAVYQQQTGLGLHRCRGSETDQATYLPEGRPPRGETRTSRRLKPQPFPLDFYMAGRQHRGSKKVAPKFQLSPVKAIDPGPMIKASGQGLGRKRRMTPWPAPPYHEESGKTTWTKCKRRLLLHAEVPHNTVLVISYTATLLTSPLRASGPPLSS